MIPLKTDTTVHYVQVWVIENIKPLPNLANGEIDVSQCDTPIPCIIGLEEIKKFSIDILRGTRIVIDGEEVEAVERESHLFIRPRIAMEDEFVRH